MISNDCIKFYARRSGVIEFAKMELTLYFGKI